MGSGIHVGIDLGTSNSAIALFDGEAVSVVANASGETLTPSVVRLDARGERRVSQRRGRPWKATRRTRAVNGSG